MKVSSWAHLFKLDTNPIPQPSFSVNHNVSWEIKNKSTFCEWGKGLIEWFLIKVKGLGEILVKSAEVLSLNPELAEVSDFTKKHLLQPFRSWSS